MKSLLLSFAFLLAVTPAIAQNLPLVIQPDSLPVAQAAPDTAAAIHRLFAARRGRSYLITAILVVPGAIGFLADGGRDKLGWAAYIVGASSYELANLLCHRRYRKKAEARALVSFQEHQLSPKIKRRLKPKYFVDAPVIRRF